MKKTRIITIAIGMAAISMALIQGCTKDTTVVLKPTEAVTRPVSFSADLIPLFSKNCAISGCHVAGAHAPDLSSANAYTALTSGDFINKGNPQASILYRRLDGELTPAMPLTSPGSDPDEINELVLGWIMQGALNN